MTTERQLCVAVVGATGALGTEVLTVLEDRRFPVSEIVPVATDDSIGADVDFQGESHMVRTGIPRNKDIDLIFLCTPADVSREYVEKLREFEHTAVVLDLSGGLAEDPDVALVVVDLGTSPEAFKEPAVATPAGPALELSIVLAAFDRAAGLRRAVATVLEPVSSGGVRGIDSLQAETIALFNQQEMPEPTVFPKTVAFDCLPGIGELDEAGNTKLERELVRDVRRLIGGHAKVAATVVQVPTFAGGGATLAVETERPLSLKEAREVLSRTPGIELQSSTSASPSTRLTAGRDAVLVGRLREDPSREGGLLLWVAADTLQLVAANAVKLAEARLLAS